ncbi:hypothetical protein MAPG_11373 [Magnaporthiopsis poae ATCC 64411]|uniref:Uncharacterized protein n=1 Tax=Magnaporthiopsis poae (strain ATCC 64411 / 73-15) TaxID=644358 RepID=A0A0C4EF38_MAGP6|nr:hypothetical protein MAPG_11373 [Magnaporthiopsis poae ATCC 64411]
MSLWKDMVVPAATNSNGLVIIVDVFDAIPADDQENFLDCLEECEEELSSRDHPDLRILILSRWCISLGNRPRGFVAYEIGELDNFQDISRTIEIELRKFAAVARYSNDFQKVVCDKIAQGAKGNYLWATAQMADIRTQMPAEHQLQEQLAEMPTGQPTRQPAEDPAVPAGELTEHSRPASPEPSAVQQHDTQTSEGLIMSRGRPGGDRGIGNFLQHGFGRPEPPAEHPRPIPTPSRNPTPPSRDPSPLPESSSSGNPLQGRFVSPGPFIGKQPSTQISEGPALSQEPPRRSGGIRNFIRRRLKLPEKTVEDPHPNPTPSGDPSPSSSTPAFEGDN